MAACRNALAKLESGGTIDDPEGYVARIAWRLARAQSQAAARQDKARRETSLQWGSKRPYFE
jgi:hypothetical protein